MSSNYKSIGDNDDMLKVIVTPVIVDIVLEEVLFWKVFNNKFIFYNIIKQIGNLWYDYRIKRTNFKYIKSVESMLNNAQLQLLKCKLIANEQLDITSNSLKLLLNKITTTGCTKSTPLLKEILLLLIKNKRVQCETTVIVSKTTSTDLLSIAIELNNLELINILVNQNEFSQPIYASTIDKLILDSNENLSKILDILLNSHSFLISSNSK